MRGLHVDPVTGHHPPPLVQGRFLGVVGDAAGYAHIFFTARIPSELHIFTRVGTATILYSEQSA